jgi:hypothetical protein
MTAIVEEYRQQAVSHGKCTHEGDSIGASSAHDKLIELATTILNSSDAPSITGLLEDEDVWVQLWAATHLLELDEATATQKLLQLSEAGIPLTSISARYTLESWNDGDLPPLVNQTSN